MTGHETESHADRQVREMRAEQKKKEHDGHTHVPIGPYGLPATCITCGIEMPPTKAPKQSAIKFF